MIPNQVSWASGLARRTGPGRAARSRTLAACPGPASWNIAACDRPLRARRRNPILGDAATVAGSLWAAPPAQHRGGRRCARHRAGGTAVGAHTLAAPSRPFTLRPPARAGDGANMTELDPERLLRTLVEHEVEFCVIGALAAWLQGSPAVTLDLDVMPRRDSTMPSGSPPRSTRSAPAPWAARLGWNWRGPISSAGRRSGSIPEPARLMSSRTPPPSGGSKTSQRSSLPLEIFRCECSRSTR